MADDPESRTEHTETFALLTDDTRVGILVELAKQQRTAPTSPGLAFSELRDRVEGRATGNFNYHLEQLVGTYVTRTEDESYRLTPRGAYLSSVITAGFYEAHPPTEIERLEAPCPECGDPLRIRHEDGLLRVVCADGHANPQLLLPRSQVERRSVDELRTAATAISHQSASLLLEGVCPLCHGPTDGSIAEATAPTGKLEVTYRCAECGIAGFGPPGLFLLQHPAVVAFLYERGIDAREVPPWSAVLWDDDRISTTIERRTPPQLRSTVRIGDDELTLRFDVADHWITVA